MKSVRSTYERTLPLNDAQRGGLTSSQFVRYGLMRLKIGQEIVQIKRLRNHSIASVEEVLGRLPELNLSS